MLAVTAATSTTAVGKTVDEVLRANPGITYLAESGKFYKFVNQNFSWDRARSLAESTILEGVKGRLIESRSAAEQAFILDHTKNFCWLGGTDVQQEGRWVWLSDGKQFSNGGSPVNGMYTNWYDRRPDNYDGIEHYVYTFDKAYRDGKWEDLRPNPSAAFVQYAVEWDATAIGVATDYFVRKHGNDNNNGRSKGKAFRTIWRALRDVKAGGTVYVGAGSYFDELSDFNSGTATAPIHFVADTTGQFTGDAGIVSTNARIEFHDRQHLRFTGFQMVGGAGILIEDSTGLVFDKWDISNCYRAFDIYSGSVEVTRSVLHENRYNGVRIYGGTVNLTNCLVSRNQGRGVEVIDNTSTTTIRHCTSVYNSGDGFHATQGPITLVNCIAAFNQGAGFNGRNNTTHSHNLSFGNRLDNFQGFAVASSEVVADPKFKNASGNDFTLQDGSPAIDKATGSEASDLAGNSRPFGPGRDIGCYEGGRGGGGDPVGPPVRGDYYVRLSGRDSNNGKSPDTAFRTIAKALAVVAPGEKVYVGAGDYRESLQRGNFSIPASKPVLMVADLSGAATGDKGAVTTTNLRMWWTSNITWDGFTFSGVPS